jgi:hypothetical protein
MPDGTTRSPGRRSLSRGRRSRSRSPRKRDSDRSLNARRSRSPRRSSRSRGRKGSDLNRDDKRGAKTPRGKGGKGGKGSGKGQKKNGGNASGKNKGGKGSKEAPKKGHDIVCDESFSEGVEVSKTLLEFSPGQEPRQPQVPAGDAGIKILVPDKVAEDLPNDGYKLLRDISSESSCDIWFDPNNSYIGTDLKQIGFFGMESIEIQAGVKRFLEHLLSEKFQQASAVFVLPLCSGSTLIGAKGVRIKNLQDSTKILQAFNAISNVFFHYQYHRFVSNFTDT